MGVWLCAHDGGVSPPVSSCVCVCVCSLATQTGVVRAIAAELNATDGDAGESAAASDAAAPVRVTEDMIASKLSVVVKRTAVGVGHRRSPDNTDAQCVWRYESVVPALLSDAAQAQIAATKRAYRHLSTRAKAVHRLLTLLTARNPNAARIKAQEDKVEKLELDAKKRVKAAAEAAAKAKAAADAKAAREAKRAADKEARRVAKAKAAAERAAERAAQRAAQKAARAAQAEEAARKKREEAEARKVAAAAKAEERAKERAAAKAAAAAKAQEKKKGVMAGISLTQFFAKAPAPASTSGDAAPMEAAKQAAADALKQVPLAAHVSPMIYRSALGALSEADIDAAMRTASAGSAVAASHPGRSAAATKDEPVFHRRRNGRRMKLLQFHDQLRPAYWGTFSKPVRRARVNGRRPFGQDTQAFNYEVDSDEEWEEGQWESLSGPDDDDEDEDGADGRATNELDYGDGWLVTDDVVERDTSGVQFADEENSDDEYAAEGSAEPKPQPRRSLVGTTVVLGTSFDISASGLSPDSGDALLWSLRAQPLAAAVDPVAAARAAKSKRVAAAALEAAREKAEEAGLPPPTTTAHVVLPPPTPALPCDVASWEADLEAARLRKKKAGSKRARVVEFPEAHLGLLVKAVEGGRSFEGITARTNEALRQAGVAGVTLTSIRRKMHIIAKKERRVWRVSEELLTKCVPPTVLRRRCHLTACCVLLCVVVCVAVWLCGEHPGMACRVPRLCRSPRPSASDPRPHRAPRRRPKTARRLARQLLRSTAVPQVVQRP